MPSCLVPGCKSGCSSTRLQNKKLGLKNPRLFGMPKDPELLKEWKDQIPEGHNILSKIDHICELHFHQDDIERYYVTNLPDGSCCKIERGIPKLKEGIVPHIFSNLLGHLSNTCSVTTETISGISSDTEYNIKKEPVSDDETNYSSRLQNESETFGVISSDTTRNINEEPVTGDEGVNTNYNYLSRFQKENETFSGISSDAAYNIKEEPLSDDERVNTDYSSRLQKENETFSGNSSDTTDNIKEEPLSDERLNIDYSSRLQKENKIYDVISSDTAGSGNSSDTAHNIKEEPVSDDERLNTDYSSSLQKENETFDVISSDTACSIDKEPVTNEERVNTNYLSRFQKENEIEIFKTNIGLIQVPDEWWGICSTPEFIICTKWNDNFSPERRVIIKNDLHVKIFIKDHEIPTEETLNNSSIEDISQLLCEVNAYKICPGIDDKFMTSCLKCHKVLRVHGRFPKWCENCRKARQNLQCKEQRRRRSEMQKFKKNKCFACVLAKAKDKDIQKIKDEKSSPNTSIEPSVDATADSTVMNDYIVLAECLISGN